MGCCGEPYDPNDASNQKNVSNNMYTTSQQPAGNAQMMYQDKQQFQQPSIPSPPPSHGFGMNPTMMQQQQQPGWGTPGLSQSPPPQSTSPFNPYAMNHPSTPQPTVSPQYTGTTAVNGMTPNGVQRPTPFYPGSAGSVNMTASKTNGVPVQATPAVADEGKMSVSIDFGVCYLRLIFE